MHMDRQMASSFTSGLIHNRYFCPQCGRPKFRFSKKKSADRFIIYNGQTILDENGYKPIRSYYCPICGYWHVTSLPATAQSNETKIARPYIEPDADERREAHRQVHRLESTIKSIMKALHFDELAKAQQLCTMALELYVASLGMAIQRHKREQLFSRLDYCISLWKKQSVEQCHRLFRVHYLHDALFYHQWFDPEFIE